MYKKLVWAAIILAFGVIVLGAYVRLNDAGLGCPDWPGCYGHLGAPETHASQAAALAAFGRAVQPAKAWKEMIHRYCAGTLGLLILAICVGAWRRRKQGGQSPWLPTAVVVLVGLQAALGMWTVTLLLKPAIVTAHLIGGMATLALLLVIGLNELNLAPLPRTGATPALRLAAGVGLALVAAQIVLGGWTSTNYAALACTGFPACNGSYAPPMDFHHGFQILRPLGLTDSGAILSMAAKTAIHWTHRLGALVVFLYVGTLSLAMMRQPGLKDFAPLLLVVLLAQVALGISNVLFSLPLAVAVAHNAGAALLLCSMVYLNFRLRHAAHINWR